MTRHPVIIIDGPDACGKTTLGRRICEMFDGRYIHLTLRKKMLEHQVVSLYMALKWSEEHPVVIDRHWISEQIYGGVYRGGTNIRREAAVMDRLITDHFGFLYVIAILRDPIEMARAHADSSIARDEMYESDSRIVEVARGYYDLWHGTKYCRYGIGHCVRVSPMRSRHSQAVMYDYQSMAPTPVELDRRASEIHALAKLRRKFVLDSLDATRRRELDDMTAASLLHRVKNGYDVPPTKIPTE